VGIDSGRTRELHGQTFVELPGVNDKSSDKGEREFKVKDGMIT
jgi:hypothetical protein